VVFDPRVTATLLSVVSSALSGESLTKGRSFFADRLGESVAAPDFTLVDDPTDPRHFSASQVDGEGLACRRNVLIDRGVLQGFVFDAISAKRAGASSTGSAIRGGYSGTPTAGCRALLLEPGTRDEDEILALVGDGIYVQSISGVHSGVNPISGDFSVGAEGMRISSGVFDQPLREMTIASTLQRLLQDVIAIGSNVEWLPGLAAGQTLAVGDISMSGA
jgi:PmbA protein